MNKLNVFKTCGRLITLRIQPLTSSQNQNIRHGSAVSAFTRLQMFSTSSVRSLASETYQIRAATDTYSPCSSPPPEPDVLYRSIEVEIRSSEPQVLKTYNKFIRTAARHLEITEGENTVARKPHIKRWTVLKSIFVHKKHMVQYEVRTYHHTLKFLRLTGSTADTFLEYIQRNLPEGVAMRVGRERLEKIPEHLLTPPSPEDLSPTFQEEDKREDSSDEKIEKSA